MIMQVLSTLPYLVVPVGIALYGMWAIARGSLDRVLLASVGALVTCVGPVVVLLVWFLLAPALNRDGMPKGRGLDLSGFDFPLAVVVNAGTGVIAVGLVLVADVWAARARERR